MTCPYIQKEDHRVWQPRTQEEFDEAMKLAGPKDPVWDWEGWRKGPEHDSGVEGWIEGDS